jgi:hypothetical protein
MSQVLSFKGGVDRVGNLADPPLLLYIAYMQ